MKIELDSHDSDLNIIKSYSTDGVMVKNTLYQSSIIVSPQQVVDNWPPRVLSDLVIAHFNQVIDMSPEIVLLGTGSRIQFPDREILDFILLKNIGVEVMDTGAACRAYNFLAGEGRLVIAALLHPEA